MREYASEQLATENELADARARHLDHFATVGIPAEEAWVSARAVTLLEERSADYGNVRAAVEWATPSEPCRAMRLIAETKDRIVYEWRSSP